jgi:hypothetical protein
MRARAITVGALASMGALALLAAPATAATGTLKGTVVGPGTPDAGEGLTAIRAVNAETGAVGGADFTGGKRDRWKLSVSPGPYAVGLATVPFGGGKAVNRLVAFGGVKAGETEKLKLKVKRKRRGRVASAARTAARGASGFGDVSVSHPAIWVKEWTIQAEDPDFGVMSRGLMDMVTTDLVAFLGTADCPGVVVERARIQDLLAEIRRQQLPAFDPSTAVRRGRLIRDNATVSGTLVQSGDSMTLSATYTDRRPGRNRTKTVSVQGSADDIFGLEQRLIEKLRQVICPAPIKHIEGTFDTSFAYGPVLTYTGNVKFDRVGPALFDGAEGVFAVVGGQYTLTVSGLDLTGATGCQQSGSKQFEIPANSGSISVTGTEPEHLEPYTYTLGVSTISPFNTMDITLHSCPPGAESYEGHVWSNYPAGGLSLNPPDTYVSDDGITFAGSHAETQGIATLTESWSLTGSP